jgi:glutathione peroxidase
MIEWLGAKCNIGFVESPISMDSFKFLIATCLAFYACASFAIDAIPASAKCPALLNFKMPRLQDDKPQDLCQYAGKVVLVVNTASYCGYTEQYRGLEALNEKYQKKGVAVLGFPSNDFGSQEPKDNKAIADFCTNTFGVKFPMFAKSQVIRTPTSNASPFYEALSKASNSQPKWNFHKYLLGKNGQIIASFPSEVSPLDARITKAIEAAL